MPEGRLIEQPGLGLDFPPGAFTPLGMTTLSDGHLEACCGTLDAMKVTIPSFRLTLHAHVGGRDRPTGRD
jgi:hypothetical protein